mgnify:CR=1 FL=1
MSNPFDSQATAVSSTAGSFQTSTRRAAPTVNKFQGLINSVARVAGVKTEATAAKNAQLNQQQGAIDVMSGEIAITDFNDNEFTTAAYRTGAKMATEQLESTSALNNMYDFLNTDEGRATSPTEFKGEFSKFLGEIDTGDASMDNLIRNNMVNNYKDIATFNSDQYRKWSEEDNHNKNTARAREGMKMVDRSFVNSGVPAEDYAGFVNTLLDEVIAAAPSNDSRNSTIHYLIDEMYKEGNISGAEAMVEYQSTNGMFGTPNQQLSNQNNRRAAERSRDRLETQQTTLQTGVSKVMAGNTADLTPEESKELVQYELLHVGQDVTARQERGEDITMAEELNKARAKMAIDGVYDVVHGKQMSADIASTFFIGDKLSTQEQASNDRKRLAVADMVNFAQEVAWDNSTLEGMYGKAGVTELLALEIAKAGSTRDIETVLTDQARLRDRETGTRAGGAKRLPIDTTATTAMVEQAFESNFIQSAFRFLMPYGNTMSDAMNGFDRPAGDNDKRLAHQYINDAAIDAQLQNPGLSMEDAVATATQQVMTSSLMIGEDEGMLFARGRNLVGEMTQNGTADDATTAITALTKEQLVDFPADSSTYYEFNPNLNAVVIEVNHPNVEFSTDIIIPMAEIQARTKYNKSPEGIEAALMEENKGFKRTAAEHKEAATWRPFGGKVPKVSTAVELGGEGVQVEQALGNLPSEDNNAITGKLETRGMQTATTATGHIDINATIPEALNTSNVEITKEMLQRNVNK